MKRKISFILCLFLLLSLFSACSSGSDTPESSPSASGQNHTPPSETIAPQDSADADGGGVITAKPGEASGFIGGSLESGFVVTLPAGAVGKDTQLRVAPVGEALDGVVSPGFSVTDPSNPGAHVTLSAPAMIAFLSKETLPDDVMIVKYSDDGKNYDPVPSLGIATDKGYLIIAEVDSFSAYGTASVTANQTHDRQNNAGHIWRVEAENHGIRIKTPGAESTDLAFFLRADSKRVPAGDGIAIPRVYTGFFDSNTFGVSEAKGAVGDAEMPVLVSMRASDRNLKLTMMAKTRTPTEADYKEYDRKFEEWYGSLGETYGSKEEEIAALSKIPDPPVKPKEIFVGYTGWGVAHMEIENVASLGDSSGTGLTIDIPLIVRVKGIATTVSFVWPGMGAVELKGRFLGLGAAEAAVPPTFFDPAADYDPGKPFQQPPVPEGDPLGELGETVNPQSRKAMLPGGGWMDIIWLMPKDEEEEEDALSFNDFASVWNEYLNLELD